MKKILVRRVDNLGDILLALPALKIIRRHFRNDHLTLMVKVPHQPLVKKFADAFIDPLPLNKLKTLPVKYDHIINIEYSSPHGYVVQPESHLPKEIHIGHPRGVKMIRHVAKLICKGARAHGLKGNYTTPKFKPDAEAIKTAAEWIKSSSINKNDLLVSIDPNSGFEKKCWSLNGFIEVSKFLINEFNCKIIIPAVDASDVRANHMLKKLPEGSCKILAGFPVDVVAAVIQHCDLHLGNDSGIGHLSAAVNTPVVTIFGPTDPFFWKPLTEKIIIVRKKESGCPGGYDHAKNCILQKCLTGIKTQDVIDGVLMAISQYVDAGKINTLTTMRISENLVIRKTKKGYFLNHTPTNHQCIIQRGWKTVKKIINTIERNGTATNLIAQNPETKILVDFLIVHRIIQFKPVKECLGGVDVKS